MPASVRPADSSVYYDSTYYWNALPEVRAYQDRLALGAAAPMGIWQFALDHYGRAAFERALVLNCGNGWVERVLVEAGVVKTAVGVDIADDLLAQARAEAAAARLPLTYEKLDINTDELPSGDFDLVINYAAAHHIAYLDRVFREIAARLGSGGVFLHWDYCGPARNQYSLDTWDAVWRLNQSLPPEFRKDLRYPHLKTMLAGDPTEAVHSDLILGHLARYFSIDHLQPTGGALAYEILKDNVPFYEPGPQQADALARVLAADENHLAGDVQRSLFFYALTRSSAEPVAPEVLQQWTAEENERERVAADRGGRYGDVALLEELYDRIYWAMVVDDRQRAEIDALTERVARLERPPEGLRVFLRGVPGAVAAVRAVRRVVPRSR